jgi:hypothetical protein
MGGMGGHSRGKTKLECYKNFRREVNRKEIEESNDMSMDAGMWTKPELYAQMKKDSKTAERQAVRLKLVRTTLPSSCIF